MLLRFERASNLAENDPGKAVALIDRLVSGEISLSAPLAKRARDIASKAAARGIPHKLELHRNVVHGLALSPNAKLIASADHDGILAVHEVATVKQRLKLELQEPSEQVVWIDDSRLVVSNRSGVHMIEVATGARTTLVTGGVTLIVNDGIPGKLRYRDATQHTLVELVVATRETKVVARDVDAFVGAGTTWLTSGSGGLRLFVGDRELLLASSSAGTQFGLAISPDGTRVAAAIDGAIVEWNLDGVEQRRVPLAQALRVIYGSPHGLYAMTMDGGLYWFGNSPFLLAQLDRLVMVIAVNKTGLLLALDDGTLFAVNGLGSRKLALRMPQTFRLATRLDSGVLALAAQSGDVRWWDLEKIIPVPIPVRDGRPCVAESDRMLVLEDTTLLELDLRARTTRKIADNMVSGVMCMGRLRNGAILFRVGPQFGLFDVALGEHRWIQGTPAQIDQRGDHILVARDNVILVLEATGREVRRWTVPHPVISLANTTSKVVVQLADYSVVEIDRATDEQVHIPITKSADFLIDDGIWFAVDREVLLWTGTVLARIRTFGQPVLFASATANPPVIQLEDGSVWRLERDGTNRNLMSRQAGKLLAATNTQLLVAQDSKLISIWLDSGERIEREVGRGPIRDGGFSDDGRKTMIVVGGTSFVVYEDQVPEDPSALRAWIATVTNATLDNLTDELTWPNPSP